MVRLDDQLWDSACCASLADTHRSEGSAGRTTRLEELHTAYFRERIELNRQPRIAAALFNPFPAPRHANAPCSNEARFNFKVSSTSPRYEAHRSLMKSLF